MQTVMWAMACIIYKKGLKLLVLCCWAAEVLILMAEGEESGKSGCGRWLAGSWEKARGLRSWLMVGGGAAE